MSRRSFKEIAQYWATAPVSAIEDKARRYAINAHANTNHFYEGHEYAFHLCHARDVAERFKYLIPEAEQPEVFGGVWNHDVIEDARKTYKNVMNANGFKIAEFALALQTHKGRTPKERKCPAYYSDIKAVDRATFIKLTDRIANAEYNRFYRADKSVKSGKLIDYQEENECFVRELYDDQYKPMFDYLNEVLFGSGE